MDADLQSEIDRYVIGDPELDRDVFEARMLEDESIALQVAKTVGTLAMVRAASTQVIRPVPARTGRTFYSKFVAVFCVAASILLMLGIVCRDRNVQVHISDEQVSIAAVAENWAVLGFAETPAEFEGSKTFVVPTLETELGSSGFDADAGDEVIFREDWMLHAAQDYFEEIEG